MTERRCGNCRWFRKDRFCWRYPEANTTTPDAACGEWSDASITPEQEEMRELTRRFAVAIMSTAWAANCPELQVWAVAASLAAAEPQIQREEGK